MDYSIRHATENDAEAIARIHVSGWHAAYHGKMPQSFIESFSYEKRRALWQKIISGALADVLVAEQNEELLGFACFGQPKTLKGTQDYDLSSLYLAPDKIGLGIGYALYQACEACLIERQAKCIRLWALDNNDTALAFYQRQGFRPTGAASKERAGEVVLNDIELIKTLVVESAI